MKNLLCLIVFCSLYCVAGDSGAAFRGRVGGVPDDGRCLGTAARMRTLPPGIPILPMMPTCVIAPGKVQVNQDVHQAFNARYPGLASGSYIFLDPAAGDDLTCAADTNRACATWNEAVRVQMAPIVYVRNTPGVPISLGGAGQYDYRYTDEGSSKGTIQKEIICQSPPCQLDVAGDVLASNLWAAVPGYPNMYVTTIQSVLSGKSGGVNTVVYQDGTVDPPYRDRGQPESRDRGKEISFPFVDSWGHPFPTRLPTTYPNEWWYGFTYTPGQPAWYSPGTTCYVAIAPSIGATPPNAAYWQPCLAGSFANGFDHEGITALAGLSSGWYYSEATKQLYVKLGGADLTQPAQASRIRATYYEEGGLPPRLFLSGTTLELVGFYLDGIGIENYEYYDDTTASYHPSELWLQNDTIFMSEGPGIDTASSDVYGYDLVTYAAERGSGLHNILGADSAVENPHIPIAEFVDTVNSQAGDVETWAAITTPLSRSHGETSHVGYQINLGVVNQDNIGAEDAAGNDESYPQTGIPTIAWWVGSISRNENPYNIDYKNGFWLAAWPGLPPTDPRQSSYYIDTSTVYHESQGPILVENGGNCFLFDVNPDLILYAPAPTNNPCRPYTPESPADAGLRN